MSQLSPHSMPRRFWPPARSTVLTLVSILLYLISLTQSAFLVEDTHHRRDWVSSLVPLMIGWLGVLEYCFAWFANPLLLIAWLPRRSPSGPYTQLVCSGVALLLALSILIVRPVLWGDNDHADVIQYGPGYYFWLASIITTLIAKILVTRRSESTQQVNDST